MGKVVVGMRTSDDGFVADRNGDSSALYPDLEEIGENEVVREAIERTGAVILGRRSYDRQDREVIERAKAAAGDRDVVVIGAEVTQQALRAGVSMRSGSGSSRSSSARAAFRSARPAARELERTRVIETRWRRTSAFG
jgi:hypothetical protein